MSPTDPEGRRVLQGLSITAELDAAVDRRLQPHADVVKDHETRLRAGEQWMWRMTAYGTVVGVIVSLIVAIASAVVVDEVKTIAAQLRSIPGVPVK